MFGVMTYNVLDNFCSPIQPLVNNHRFSDTSKITSGVTADVFNVVEQNVIRLLNRCQPQTLFRAIFQKLVQKTH